MQPVSVARSKALRVPCRRRLRRTVTWSAASVALSAITLVTPRASAQEPSVTAPINTNPRTGDGPDEVHVNGVKKTDPTAPRDTMGGREIRQVPGAFGDAFRAVESLPGVTPITSGIPYFFVRGAPPGNTGFFVDGVRVPGLFHLGIGPAVLYPALIDRVDLYKSAYPVSFGRLAGGILSAETVPPAQRSRVDWTLRLFDAGALVETPFGHRDDGSPRGTALVSGRYGYPGLLLSVLTPDVGLAYWDYQARLTYDVSPRDVVSVFSLGSYDSISARRDEKDGAKPDLHEVLNLQFHRLDLRWDHRTSATGSLRAAVTLGFDRTSSETFAARSILAGARVLASERISNAVHIRAGADVWAQTYDFRATLAPNDDLEVDRVRGDPGIQKDVNIATWVDAPLQIAPRAQVTPGLRADLFTSRGIGNARAVPALDPRVTARIGIGPIYYLGGIGLAHQPSTLPLPIPALTFAQLRRGLQGGYQVSQGIEVPLPWEFTGTATGYMHTYTGLVDLAVSCNDDRASCSRSLTRGRSTGIEVMLKRNLAKRFGGWIAYTLSRSTREAWDASSGRQATVLSQFDRTHVFNLVLSIDIGKGWRTGARYAAYSGVPYSTVSPAGLPNARTPAFHRVDLRLEKRWFYAEGRSFAFSAELFNALLMKEAIGITCAAGSGCSPEGIGPIVIPSLGCEGNL